MSRHPVMFVAALCLAVAATSATGQAAGREPASASSAESHDALAAEAAGLVEVKFIPNDSRSAQIIVTNRSDRPLSLRLPAAFAGVPVLAQMAGGNQAGFGAGGIGAQPQAVGGGAQNAGMGIGGGAGAQPFCWVAREVYGPHDPRWLVFRDWMQHDAPGWLHDAYRDHGEALASWIHERPAAKQVVRGLMDAVVEPRLEAEGGAQFRLADGGTGLLLPAGRTRTVRVTTVCLEHGRAEPSPRRAYKLVALGTFSGDPRLSLLMESLGRGELSQRVAQAAAWHVSSGLSWERLAAEKIDHAGGDPDEPFFSAPELHAARAAVVAMTARDGDSTTRAGNTSAR